MENEDREAERGNMIGMTCPYCQTPIKQMDNVVVCAGCSMPHHLQCWNEAQGCTTFGCNGKLPKSAATATTCATPPIWEGVNDEAAATVTYAGPASADVGMTANTLDESKPKPLAGILKFRPTKKLGLITLAVLLVLPIIFSLGVAKFGDQPTLYGLYKSDDSNAFVHSYTGQLIRLGWDEEEITKFVLADLDTGEEPYSKTLQLSDELVPDQKDEMRKATGEILVKDLKAAANSQDFDAAAGVLQTFQELGIGNQGDIATLLKEIETYESLAAKRVSLKTQSSSMEIELDSLKQERQTISDYLAGFDPFTLEAYMISFEGEDTYEIALPGYDYYGSYPSDNHAILITTETSYSSKGWFTLMVQLVDYMDVTLKEEYGGFVETWPVYKEVSQAQLDELAEQSARLDEIDAQINSLAKEKNSLNAELKTTTTSVNQKREALINDLLSFGI